MAERYLYSCYSFLPNPRHETASLDLMTADEVVTPWEHETFANFPKMCIRDREIGSSGRNNSEV